MNKHQLKLAKLYAKLIGYSVELRGDNYYGAETHGQLFNPFIGQLQLDARDDYGAEIEYEKNRVAISNDNGCFTVRAECREELSMASIECILKSKGKL